MEDLNVLVTGGAGFIGSNMGVFLSLHSVASNFHYIVLNLKDI